jgi:type VI secretion system secreted protein VgrG
MPVIRTSLETKYTFENEAYGPDLLGVVSFNGTEQMSVPFEYDIDLAVKEELDYDKLIGKQALLSIPEAGGSRLVHGIVNEIEYLQQGNVFYRYRISFVPRLWLLSLGDDRRIFQQMTIPEIIEQVLKDAGFTTDQYRFIVNRDYKPRQYCVQYGESDLIFISRLMEENGLFYYFEHKKDDHVLVMGDHPGANVSIPDPNTISYREPTGTVDTEECIEEFSLARAIREGKIVLNDFNFKKPALDLKSPENAEVDKELEVYEFPGEYEEGAEGKALAKIRLEELQVPRKVAAGRCSSFRLIPGYRFTLDEHPQSALNQEYLITTVTNSGYQPQTLEEEAGGSGEGAVPESGFHAIPASVPFRAPRQTGRTRMPGVQTAIVVGPDGEEIYTDEYGRIKVQFHWDRQGQKNEKSSCWIRVSQTWASTGWGSMVIPRIGQEVIVDFIEGDPDRPIVTGCVYNGANPLPYPLPAEKTKTTIKTSSSKGGDGFNEIRFEDKKGEEQIFIHAEKNHDIRVKADQFETIGNNAHFNVKKDRFEHIENNRNATRRWTPIIWKRSETIAM